jgi:hypothetical protein
MFDQERMADGETLIAGSKFICTPIKILVNHRQCVAGRAFQEYRVPLDLVRLLAF